jgi:hypothetical protein
MRQNKEYSITLLPAVAVQTYKTSRLTGYGPKPMFLDMAGGQSVPHYGLNLVTDCFGLNPADTI